MWAALKAPWRPSGLPRALHSVDTRRSSPHLHWRVHQGSGGAEPVPQRHARVHAKLRRHHMPDGRLSRAAARRDFQGREPQRFLCGSVQHDRMARSGRLVRRFIGGATDRRTGHSSPMAGGRRAGARRGAGVGARRVCQAQPLERPSTCDTLAVTGPDRIGSNS